ncbi:Beta-glucan synthesis-associated protein [Mycena sanguinolenta]|uniref:Beta-glucan synthesis-associated protein n=1 Tax=Mycena sanguinolenta TaxID=230812 RepID=A0A8H6ZJT6_9AGAR|nr:Beta-glucan synthesis-associated protein [Mycena sanguinolenta]
MASALRRSHNTASSFSLLSNVDSPDWESRSTRSGVADKYSLSPDPALWGSNLSPNLSEPDDALHNPEMKSGKFVDNTSFSFSSRAFYNIGCLVVLCLALLALFIGYPVVSFVKKTFLSPTDNRVNVNATGQVPSIGNFGLIDLDTPSDAYTITSLHSGNQMKLVFSDEFNTDGRTFYPGDDPYWEAVDLHYWETNNMEWYDPAAVTTANGSLHITLSAKETHGLNYQGGELYLSRPENHIYGFNDRDGTNLARTSFALLASHLIYSFRHSRLTSLMLTLGGLLVASATIPGTNNILGLWPAVWAMGNLGRAGYGASLDGMWASAKLTLDGSAGLISYSPATRMSRTTVNFRISEVKDCLAALAQANRIQARFMRRMALMLEGRRQKSTYSVCLFLLINQLLTFFPPAFRGSSTITDGVGTVSQSGQWAPFNAAYVWYNTSENLIIPNPDISVLNSYTGGAFQQATSVVTQTNQKCYELLDNCFSEYGFEYQPGFGDAYISWISDGAIAWTLNVAGMTADSQTQIGDRPVPQEPMYILANLGMSTNFGTVDLEHLTFPTTLKLDWVRVYQYPDQINIGCDPEDFPTQAYINTYAEAYSNPNLTTWVDDYKQTVPKNSFLGEC